MKISKGAMSSYMNGRRFPMYELLGRLYSMGISIDYLISGKGPILIHGIENIEDVAGLINGELFDIEIKDDKMSSTINHGDIITVKKVPHNKLEAGGIYYVERKLGTRFLARLVSDTHQWVYDNQKYKSFTYEPSAEDKVIAKVIKNISYHFPTPA